MGQEVKDIDSGGGPGSIKSPLDGTERIEIQEAAGGLGSTKQTTTQAIADLGGIPFRGTWAGTNAFPTTGGTFTGGVPGAGNMWVLTDTLTIGSDIYAPGSIILALVNTPGQTRANWAVLSVQL